VGRLLSEIGERPPVPVMEQAGKTTMARRHGSPWDSRVAEARERNAEARGLYVKWTRAFLLDQMRVKNSFYQVSEDFGIECGMEYKEE
jgi:hypothetical protein